MEDMGTPVPAPRARTRADDTQKAKVGDQYAARHNPFVYFHSITDSPSCAANDVDLSRLTADLSTVATTRNLTYITPNLCNDAHDSPCVDGRPGGLVTADQWLSTWIPKILASPAYQQDGLLVVTFDEADTASTDGADACCGEGPGPNAPLPGIYGMGGGRTGTVLVSPFLDARHAEQHRLQPLLAAAHHREHLRPGPAGLRRGPLAASATTSGGPDDDTTRPQPPPGPHRCRRCRRRARPRRTDRARPRPPSCPRRVAPASTTSWSLMMENRSFDHYLGWLPGADGKQAGLSYVDRDGVSRSTHHLHRLPGLRAPRPRPLLRGRPRAVQRRPLRRLAALGGERRVRDRLLRAAATSGSTATRRRTGRRSTATSPRPWPRRTRTASTSTARRPTGSTTRPTSPRCRRSGTGWRTRAVSHAYYYVDVPFLALYGHEVPRHRPHLAAVPASTRRPGTLPAVSFLDPKFLDEGERHLRGRPPARRHPRRAVVPQRRLRGGHRRAGLGAHRAGRQLRRVGRLLRPRAAARPPRTRPRRPAPGMRGFRTPALHGLAAGPARARRARRLRPHLGAEDDRVALGSRPADAARRRGPQHRRGAGLRSAPNLAAPRWSVPPAVSAPCGPEGTADYTDWRNLTALAQSHGWRVGGTV